MRYTIQRFKLAEDHPLWAGETVYKIVDTYTGYIPLSCYTSLEAAEKILDLKLTRLGNIV